MLLKNAFLHVSFSTRPRPCSAAYCVGSQQRLACSACRHPATLLSCCQPPNVLLTRLAHLPSACTRLWRRSVLASLGLLCLIARCRACC